jgi:hypothetical protein
MCRQIIAIYGLSATSAVVILSGFEMPYNDGQAGSA